MAGRRRRHVQPGRGRRVLPLGRPRYPRRHQRESRCPGVAARARRRRSDPPAVERRAGRVARAGRRAGVLHRCARRPAGFAPASPRCCSASRSWGSRACGDGGGEAQAGARRVRQDAGNHGSDGAAARPRRDASARRTRGLERKRAGGVAGEHASAAPDRRRRHHARRGRALADRSHPAHRRRGGALSPARGAGRGGAPLRDRRRAGGDDRGAAPRAGAHRHHHGPRHRGADLGAGRPRAAAAAPRSGRSPLARQRRRDAGDDGLPAGRDGHRGGGVQRPRRDPRRVRLRHGGAGAGRVVGRRHHVDPRFRPHDPALAPGAGRGDRFCR